MLSLIVAMTENRVIGLDGDMPWRMSSDLRRFKQITMGHHMIMGRRTFDSIGRALPGRTSIVVSRTVAYDQPHVRVARNLDQALSIAAGDDQPFVTGGSKIFELAMPLVERIYLTRIHAEVDGDTYFPKVDWSWWKVTHETRHPADDSNDFPYSFLTYDRISDHE
jgi:dihydrofolate reductase